MKNKVLINKYPAHTWQSASPIGNGRLGALVMGSIYDERIIFNHEGLYDGAVNKDIPDISSSLKEVRKLMDEKKYSEAEVFYTNALKEKEYFANKGWFFPAFDLHFIYKTSGAFKDYSRELDLQNGISTIRFKEEGNEVIRESFVSKKDKFVFINIRKEKPFSLNFTLEPRDESDAMDYLGNKIEELEKFDVKVQDKYIFVNAKTIFGLTYSGVAKILETDGKISLCEEKNKLQIDMQGVGDLQNSLKIENATYITLVIDVEDKHLNEKSLRKIIDRVNDDYETIKLRHTKSFSKEFNKIKLNISENKNISNDELLLKTFSGDTDFRLIEKMADYGRYLLLSSSINCKYPANLQGIWNGDYRPVWSATFFNNENIQMCYWQALPGNMSKALLPLFNLYDSLKADYRMNAKNLFGCRGILLPLFMDNKSGKKDNLQPHVLYWTGSSAWIAQFYYDYYLFTLDKKFLVDRAIPFMKEAALFYEDFYVEDENGYLKSYPADSPENRPNGNFKGAKEISCSINPTMDFSLLKELLTNLIEAHEANDIKEPKLKVWKDMLSKIPAYEINKDGAIKEWLHEDFLDNYMHRHQSHIYSLFPGREITKENNEKIFESIKVAVGKRLNIGLTEQTGWSLAHMANIYCRLNEGDDALNCLNLLTRFCTNDNLFTFHNDDKNMGVTLKYLYARRKPFQIDANMGFTSAVYEMFIFSNNNKIDIFPALPSLLKKGSVKGLVARGGFKVDLKWDEKKARVVISSAGGTKAKIKINGGYLSKSYKQNNGYIEVYVTNKPVVLDFSKND